MRQLNLLGDVDIEPFDSSNNETEHAITTILVMRIIVSGLIMLTSISAIAGLLREVRMALLPFLLSMVIGTSGKFFEVNIETVENTY